MQNEQNECLSQLNDPSGMVAKSPSKPCCSTSIGLSQGMHLHLPSPPPSPPPPPFPSVRCNIGSPKTRAVQGDFVDKHEPSTLTEGTPKHLPKHIENDKLTWWTVSGRGRTERKN
jgi:hypothetical protein